MNSEYIKFEYGEKKSLQKSFLTSELLLLDSLKKCREYKQIRTEEILLKIALKAKIEDIINKIARIEKMMPKTSIIVQKGFSSEDERKDYTLEEEIDFIKRKLDTLNAQF